jgi:hypothetical protein
VTVTGSDRPRPAVATVPEPPEDDGGSPSPDPPPMGGGDDGGGGGRDCYDPHPQFRTFNFAPALDGTLKVRGAKVDVQTSVTARVVVKLERSGRRVASRSQRARNDREVTRVKLGTKLVKGVRYVVEMKGRALNDSRIRRCDRRYLQLK